MRAPWTDAIPVRYRAYILNLSTVLKLRRTSYKFSGLLGYSFLLCSHINKVSQDSTVITILFQKQLANQMVCKRLGTNTARWRLYCVHNSALCVSVCDVHVWLSLSNRHSVWQKMIRKVVYAPAPQCEPLQTLLLLKGAL